MCLGRFRVTVESIEEAVILRATGEIDRFTVDSLRAPLAAARIDGMTAIVDLSGVTFIDSSGLSALLDAADHAERGEWAWFLVRPSAVVARMIAMTRTAQRLPLVVPPQASGWTEVRKAPRRARLALLRPQPDSA